MMVTAVVSEFWHSSSSVAQEVGRTVFVEKNDLQSRPPSRYRRALGSGKNLPLRPSYLVGFGTGPRFLGGEGEESQTQCPPLLRCWFVFSQDYSADCVYLRSCIARDHHYSAHITKTAFYGCCAELPADLCCSCVWSYAPGFPVWLRDRRPRGALQRPVDIAWGTRPNVIPRKKFSAT